MPHMKALTEKGLSDDVHAAFGWLRDSSHVQPARIASIGFCMGGRIAFLAALICPAACAISFYGGGIAPNPMSPGLLDRVDELRAPDAVLLGRHG